MAKNKHKKKGTTMNDQVETTATDVAAAESAAVIASAQITEEPAPVDPAVELAKLQAELAVLQALESADNTIKDICETAGKESAPPAMGKPVAQGAAPVRNRPVYKLLAAPTQLHKTPQVRQLQEILFGYKATEVPKEKMDEPLSLTEDEVFAIVKAGAQAGMLKTKQDPARIFNYYRNHLLAANNIKWS